jgi:PAS domain S-box-containing protein
MPYRFSDIVDIEAIQDLMDNLWQASGIPTGIVDIDGTVLVGAGWQTICTQFHRRHPETRARCLQSDAFLARYLNEHSVLPECGYIEYRCQNGMIDIGMPIIIEGHHLANIFLGQFFYEPPDEKFFRQQARKYGFDLKDYLATLRQVPVFPPQKVQQILTFNKSLLALITRMGVEKLRQMETQRDLLQSREKFHSLFENSSDAIFILSVDGHILEANQIACQQFGFSRQQLLHKKLAEFLPPDRNACFADRVRKIQREGHLLFETVHLRNGKTPFPVEISIRPFTYQNQPALLATSRDISDRKNAEKQARESDRRLATLMANISGMAYRCRNDRHWTMEFVSEGSLALTGYAPTDLTGNRTISYGEIIQPEDRERIWRMIQNALPREKFTLEYRILTASGEQRWVFEQGQGVFAENGSLLALEGFITDITDRKQAENRLQKALHEAKDARDRIAAIFAHIAEGLIVSDIEGRIVTLNQATEKLLGLQARDALQRPLTEIIHDPIPQKYLAAVCAGEEHPDIVEWERIGDPVSGNRTLQAKASMVHDHTGEKTGVITILRDVTRERELDRLKSEFICTAAHELRSPLTSVMGYAELLLQQQTMESTQRSEFLTIIYEKSHELARIIDDMLNLSRAESGQIVRAEKTRCDLAATVRLFIKNFRQSHPDRPLTLDVPDKPLPLWVDGKKINQVLDNLLSNAVKFSAPRSPIAVALQETADTVRIIVRDQGVGMTPQQVERIFDKFYRADSSNTAKAGLGLGLAIVKSIVDAHEGEIRVGSRLGSGTDITVILPKTSGQ